MDKIWKGNRRVAVGVLLADEGDSTSGSLGGSGNLAYSLDGPVKALGSSVNGTGGDITRAVRVVVFGRGRASDGGEKVGGLGRTDAGLVPARCRAAS